MTSQETAPRPRRRRREHRLERVLGTPALFATAYGNVGSSIYYALGLTAVYALGLTPLVFVIAGIIFAATAATYAEGTVRYPEAGGSSSFARHAFNEARELRRRLGPDARLHRHGRHVRVLRAPLPVRLLGAAAREPGRHRRRRDRHRRARRPEHRRRPGGGEAERDAGGDRLRHAGAAGDPRLCPRFQPRGDRRQHLLGRRADVVAAGDRDSGGDARLHGSGDRVEPRRGGPRSLAHRAGGLQVGGGRRLCHLLHAAPRGAVRDAGADDRRRADDAARAAPGARWLRERPGARRCRQPRGNGGDTRRTADLRRDPRGDDPHRRHQRRCYRRLTHHVLDGHVPTDPRGVPQAPSPLQDPMAVAPSSHERRHHRRFADHVLDGVYRSSGRLPKLTRVQDALARARRVRGLCLDPRALPGR